MGGLGRRCPRYAVTVADTKVFKDFKAFKHPKDLIAPYCNLCLMEMGDGWQMFQDLCVNLRMIFPVKAGFPIDTIITLYT